MIKINTIKLYKWSKKKQEYILKMLIEGVDNIYIDNSADYKKILISSKKHKDLISFYCTRISFINYLMLQKTLDIKTIDETEDN